MKNCLNCKYEPNWEIIGNISAGACKLTINITKPTPPTIKVFHAIKINVDNYDRILIADDEIKNCEAWKKK